jgi:hypothetical protein
MNETETMTIPENVQADIEADGSSIPEAILVEIALIDVLPRLREINRKRIEEMKSSIEEIGLLQPIIITTEYRLIGGKHRLVSCQEMGWTHIPAVIKEYTDVDALIAEIDENLIRYDLTGTERAEHLAKRKAIHEAKYPQTTNSPERRKRAEETAQELGIVPESGTSPAKSFVEETSEKTGRSTSVIRAEAELGELIMEKLSDEIRGLIRPTSISKKDLQRLTGYPEDLRLQIAEKISEAHENGKNLSVAEALNVIQGGTTHAAVTENTNGAGLVHTALDKTEKLLRRSIGGTDFQKLVGLWTKEGAVDVRDTLQNIRDLADKGIDVISEVID